MPESISNATAQASTGLSAWLEGSGLVDDTGAPRIFYHGTRTPENLTRFIPGGVDDSITTGDAYGVASYFTSSPVEASYHAREIGAVFPVFLRGELLDVDGALTELQKSRLTELGAQALQPSDKARFEIGRVQQSFDQVEEAREFFATQRTNWEFWGDGMDRARPEAAVEGGKYIVRYTDFNAPVPITSGHDAFVMFKAIGWHNLRSAGFDGLRMGREDGSEWVVLHQPDGNVKSATGNDGTYGPYDADIMHSLQDQLQTTGPNFEHLALNAFLTDDLVQVFHGTHAASAEKLLTVGKSGSADFTGANLGQRDRLYVTTDPENARWFAEQSGGAEVLSILVEASQLRIDPEDGVHANVEAELRAAVRSGIPASLSIVGDVPASAFGLHVDISQDQAIANSTPYTDGLRARRAMARQHRVESNSLATYDQVSQREWLGSQAQRRDSLVTVYRALRDGQAVHPGDYVTSSRAYAEAHLANNMDGRGSIVEIEVDLDDLFPADGPKEFWLLPHSLEVDSPVPPTETAEFKSWFGQSKIVGSDGRPQIAFHGTTREFSAFDAERLGEKTGGADAFGGFFFAENPKSAEQFIWENGEKTGYIMPVFLAMKNPLVSDHLLDGSTGRFAGRVIAAAKAAGHDGVIFEKSDMLGHVGKTFVMFDEKAIKSAVGNLGSFDRSNPDIRYSVSDSSEQDGVPAALPAFERWFGQSKVAENGKPVVVYHGTSVWQRDDGRQLGDVHVFDRMATVNIVRRGHSIDTVGSWFSSKSGDEGAAMYSGSSGAIYPMYLSIQNPYITSFNMMTLRANMLAGLPEDSRPGKASVDALRHWLKETGRDGVKLVGDGHNGSTEFINQVGWIVLEPHQAKSAVGNVGSYDPQNPDIRYSLNEDAPRLGNASRAQSSIFYSHLQRVIAAAPSRMSSMPASQWSAWLEGNAARLGVKKEELEWSGVREFLALQGNGKLSAQDLVGYLADNGMAITERTSEQARDNPAFDSGRDAIEFLMSFHDQTEEELREDYGDLSEVEFLEIGNEAHENLGLDGDAGSRFAKYVVPGAAKRYRDVQVILKRHIPARVLELQGRSKSGEFLRGPERSELAEWGKANRGFADGHWDEADVLVHLRVDDRIDAKGKRVLMVNEIQSDWGQKGKRNGFDASVIGVSKLGDAYFENGFGAQQQWLIQYSNGKSATVVREVAASEEDVLVRAQDSLASLAVPKGPFVEKTEVWVALGIKRALVMAVRGGYDKVAIVGGEQAVAMFDLSKQVQMIMAVRQGEGGFEIFARDTNGKNSNMGVYSADRLPDVVGKSLADKIEAQVKDRECYEGVDLKVGGTGLKTFYNEIVPQVASGVLKRLGGEGLTTVNLDRTGRYRVVDSGCDYVVHGEKDRIERRVASKRTANQIVQELGGGGQQLGFDITPAMRELVLGGVPMFSVKVQPAAATSRGAATVETMRSAIADLVRVSAEELVEGIGRIAVVDSAGLSQKWPSLVGEQASASENVARDRLVAAGGKGGSQAFHDRGTNTTVFVADRINRGNEKAVFLHEIVHRHGRSAMDEGVWDGLVSQVKAWRRHGIASDERRIHDAAVRRAARSGETGAAFDEELFAYAVEEAVSRGIAPTAAAIDGSAEAWLGAVVASIRGIGEKLIGNDLDGLGLQDAVDLAYALAQLENPEYSERVRQELDLAMERGMARGMDGHPVADVHDSDRGEILHSGQYQAPSF